MSDDYGEMVKLKKYKYKLHSKGDRFRDKKDNTIWEITGINTDLKKKIARNNYKNDINNFVNYTLQNEKGDKEIVVYHGDLKNNYNQFMFDDIRSLFSRGGNRKSRKPKKSKKNNKKRRATRRK